MDLRPVWFDFGFMKRGATRVIAVGLCASLFAQVGWGHQGEANVWAERKRSLTLAALPSPNAFPPLNALANSAVRLPVAVPSTSKRTVIHIQDVHLNEEAQSSIAETVRAAIDENRVGLVALEGAFGPVDLSTLRSFPQKETLTETADYLLRSNQISGSLHAALTSDRATAVVGVDDEAHYEANVRAYRDSLPLARKNKASLEQAEKELAAKKQTILSPALLNFDRAEQAYHAGTLPIGDYLAVLVSINKEAPSNVTSFIEAHRLEKTINFEAVKAQREALSAALVDKLTPQETKDFLAAGLAYRLQRKTTGDFYRAFETLCEKHGLSLTRFPAMTAYLRYVRLSDAISGEKLFEELGALERDAVRSLAVTPEQKQAMEESRRLYLTGKLFDFSLTNADWFAYRRGRLPRRPESTETAGIVPPGGHGGPPLRPFEIFYSEADARSRAMAENLLREMDHLKTNTAVLVTGGFHSKDIDAMLEAKGLQVVSIVPKITKVDSGNGSAYLSVFAQEKTPLEKLFEGQKLFLSPKVATSAMLGGVMPMILSALSAFGGNVKNANVKGDSVRLERGNVRLEMDTELAGNRRRIKTAVFKEAAWAGAHLFLLTVPLWMHVPSAVTAVTWVLVSASLHESAHAFAARLVGAGVVGDRVTLNPFAHLFEKGRLAKVLTIQDGPSVTPARHAFYIAAGPLANLALGALGLVFLQASELNVYWVLTGINFLFFGLNLLPLVFVGTEPVYFDGAHLWRWFGLNPLTLPPAAMLALAGSCRAMQIAEVNRAVDRGIQGKKIQTEDEIRVNRQKAGRQLVKALEPFIEEFTKEANKNAKVKTQVEEVKVEHAANHAIQDAVDKAVKTKDFSEEAFKQTVRARLVDQLRAHENGGMTDDQAAVIEAMLKNVADLGEIANAWQNQFGVLKNLSGFTEEELKKLTESTGSAEQHGHSHGRAHVHSHGGHWHTHLVTPFDFILRWALWFFSGAVANTPQEDVYAWLKTQVPELKEEEIQFLKTYTNDKELQTDKPLIEQPEVLARIINALNVPYGQKNSVLLVGKKGVGKSTLLKLINQKISKGLLTGPIAQRRFLSLGTITGSMNQTAEQKYDQLLQILTKCRGRIVLFKDEMHSLTRGINDTTDFALADKLKPYLEDGRVTLVGATTFIEQRKFILKDSAYQDRFNVIKIPEPSAEQAEVVLRGYKAYFEKEFGVEIPNEAITEVVALAGPYLPEDSFPRKAVDTLRNVCSSVFNTHNSLTLKMVSLAQTLEERVNVYIGMIKKGTDDTDNGIALHNQIVTLANDLKIIEAQRNALGIKRVTKELVRDYITQMTGIDILRAGQKDPRRYLDMEKSLEDRVAGQSDAVVAIAEATRRAKAGLKEKHRPIGSFIFVGPTGVGKTELAKALAAFEFGDEEAMVRLDMSEYQEKHNVARLIGSPPGYVGFEEGGQLTEQVYKRPYSVVLFDEIEKAHPDVLNIMLQILDDGRLTDGQGKVVDFKNTIIIVTSNLGMDLVQGTLKELRAKLKKTDSAEEMQSLIDQMNAAVASGVANGIDQAIRERRLRPEFLNRFDGQIVFNVLTPEVMAQIARIQLSKNLTSLLNGQGYDLDYGADVIRFLASEGYDAVLGARPLKRLIDQRIKTPLSSFILESHSAGKGVNGGIIKLAVNGDKIVFSIQEKSRKTLEKKEPTQAVHPLIALIQETADSAKKTLDEAAIVKSLGVVTSEQGVTPEKWGNFSVNTPLAFQAQTERVSYNANPKRKDGGVIEAAEMVTKAAKELGASDETLETLSAWINEFVRFAKMNTEESSVALRWTFDRNKKTLRMGIDQTNRLRPETVQELRVSLEPSPATADEILDVEAKLIEEGKKPLRSLMKLKLALSEIPGARFGAGDSAYWLELPYKSAQPVPAPAPAASVAAPAQPASDRSMKALIVGLQIPENSPQINRGDEKSVSLQFLGQTHPVQIAAMREQAWQIAFGRREWKQYFIFERVPGKVRCLFNDSVGTKDFSFENVSESPVVGLAIEKIVGQPQRLVITLKEDFYAKNKDALSQLPDTYLTPFRFVSEESPAVTPVATPKKNADGKMSDLVALSMADLRRRNPEWKPWKGLLPGKWRDPGAEEAEGVRFVDSEGSIIFAKTADRWVIWISPTPQESGAQLGWVSNQISIARFQISVGKQLAPLSGFVNDPFEAVQWFPSTKRLLVTLDRSVLDDLEQKKMLVLKGKETYAQNSDSGQLGWRITNKYEAPDSPPDPKAGVTPAGLSLTRQPYIDNLLQRVFSSDEEYIVWSNIDKSLPEHLRRKGLPDDAAGVSALKASLIALRGRPVASDRVLIAITQALALIDELENKPRTTLLGLMNVSEDTPQALTARIKQARWDAFKTWIAQEANHVASSLSVFEHLFYAEYIPSLAHFERHDDGLHLLLNQILDREAPEDHEYAWQLLHLMIIEHELMQVRLRNYPNYYEPNLLIEEMALFYEVDLPRWNSFSIDEKQQIRRLAVFLRQENPALGNSLIDSLDRLEYYAGNWDSTSTWSKLAEEINVFDNLKLDFIESVFLIRRDIIKTLLAIEYDRDTKAPALALVLKSGYAKPYGRTKFGPFKVGIKQGVESTDTATSIFGLNPLYSANEPAALSKKAPADFLERFKRALADLAPEMLALAERLGINFWFASNMPSLFLNRWEDDGTAHVWMDPILDRAPPEGHEGAWDIVHAMGFAHETAQLNLGRELKTSPEDLLTEEVALFAKVDLKIWKKLSDDQRTAVTNLAVHLDEQEANGSLRFQAAVELLNVYMTKSDDAVKWRDLGRELWGRPWFIEGRNGFDVQRFDPVKFASFVDFIDRTVDDLKLQSLLTSILEFNQPEKFQTPADYRALLEEAKDFLVESPLTAEEGDLSFRVKVQIPSSIYPLSDLGAPVFTRKQDSQPVKRYGPEFMNGRYVIPIEIGFDGYFSDPVKMLEEFLTVAGDDTDPERQLSSAAQAQIKDKIAYFKTRLTALRALPRKPGFAESMNWFPVQINSTEYRGKNEWSVGHVSLAGFGLEWKNGRLNYWQRVRGDVKESASVKCETDPFVTVDCIRGQVYLVVLKDQIFADLLKYGQSNWPGPIRYPGRMELSCKVNDSVPYYFVPESDWLKNRNRTDEWYKTPEQQPATSIFGLNPFATPDNPIALAGAVEKNFHSKLKPLFQRLAPRILMWLKEMGASIEFYYADYMPSLGVNSWRPDSRAEINIDEVLRAKPPAKYRKAWHLLRAMVVMHETAQLKLSQALNTTPDDLLAEEMGLFMAVDVPMWNKLDYKEQILIGEFAAYLDDKEQSKTNRFSHSVDRLESFSKRDYSYQTWQDLARELSMNSWLAGKYWEDSQRFFNFLLNQPLPAPSIELSSPAMKKIEELDRFHPVLEFFKRLPANWQLQLVDDALEATFAVRKNSVYYSATVVRYDPVRNTWNIKISGYDQRPGEARSYYSWASEISGSQTSMSIERIPAISDRTVFHYPSSHDPLMLLSWNAESNALNVHLDKVAIALKETPPFQGDVQIKDIRTWNVLATDEQKKSAPRTSLLGLKPSSKTDAPAARGQKVKSSVLEKILALLSERAPGVASVAAQLGIKVHYADGLPSLATNHWKRGAQIWLETLLRAEPAADYRGGWLLLQSLVTAHEIMQLKLRKDLNPPDSDLLNEELAVFAAVDFLLWRNLSKQQINEIVNYVRIALPSELKAVQAWIDNVAHLKSHTSDIVWGELASYFKKWPQFAKLEFDLARFKAFAARLLEADGGDGFNNAADFTSFKKLNITKSKNSWGVAFHQDDEAVTLGWELGILSLRIMKGVEWIQSSTHIKTDSLVGVYRRESALGNGKSTTLVVLEDEALLGLKLNLTEMDVLKNNGRISGPYFEFLSRSEFERGMATPGDAVPAAVLAEQWTEALKFADRGRPEFAKRAIVDLIASAPANFHIDQIQGIQEIDRGNMLTALHALSMESQTWTKDFTEVDAPPAKTGERHFTNVIVDESLDAQSTDLISSTLAKRKNADDVVVFTAVTPLIATHLSKKILSKRNVFIDLDPTLVEGRGKYRRLVGQRVKTIYDHVRMTELVYPAHLILDLEGVDSDESPLLQAQLTMLNAALKAVVVDVGRLIMLNKLASALVDSQA